MYAAAARLGDDGVVDDAALLVGEAGQAAGAVRQAGDVAHDQPLQEGDRVLALHGRTPMIIR
jgi:hypothetical protein